MCIFINCHTFEKRMFETRSNLNNDRVENGCMFPSHVCLKIRPTPPDKSAISPIQSFCGSLLATFNSTSSLTMATFTMSSGVASNKKMGCSVRGLRALPAAPRAARSNSIITRAAAVAAEDVPDMPKRTTMNLLLLGAISAPVALLAGPFAYFFVPKG